MAPFSMLALAFAAAAATTVSCMPHNSGGWGDWNGKDSHWGRDSTPTLPLSEVANTGATALPTPTGTLKYIDLGLGFQNYSCSPTGTWIQTVTSAGAVAELYDITSRVNKNTKDSITQTTLKSFEKCLDVTKCSPDPSNDYCGKCHEIAAAAFLGKFAGEHFFEAVPPTNAQSPNFDISAKGDYLSAMKKASVSAPASAYDGENALGAIAWLYLVPNASGRTHGLNGVYRVETAGGVAPSSCSEPGSQLQVPYAAEYWFYD